MPALTKKKILIVEDEEPLSRFLYEEELKEEGYEVLTGCYGKEAPLRLDVEKPDLIVLDITMPAMDGVDALGPYCRKGGKISIILNTSYPEYRQDLMMSWIASANEVNIAYHYAHLPRSLDLKDISKS